ARRRGSGRRGGRGKRPHRLHAQASLSKGQGRPMESLMRRRSREFLNAVLIVAALAVGWAFAAHDPGLAWAVVAMGIAITAAMLAATRRPTLLDQVVSHAVCSMAAVLLYLLRILQPYIQL